MQPLDFCSQFGFVSLGTIQKFVGRRINLANFHNVDAVFGGRRDLDKFSANIVAGSVKFMALQRGNNKDLDIFSAHPKRHQLHCEGFPCSGCAKQCHVGILIYSRIKDIHDNQRVIVFVDTKQDSVIIAHLKRCEGIAACNAGSQYVPFGTGEQLSLQRYQRQCRQHRLLFPKMTGYSLHVLRQQQLFHFVGAPLQFFQAVGCDGNENVHIIEILIICQSIL